MAKQRASSQFVLWLVTFLLVFGVAVRAATDKGEVLLALNTVHTPALDSFFARATHLGDAGPYWVAVFVLLFVRLRHALAAGLLGLSTLVFTGGLKTLFGQPRPFTWFGELGLLDLLTPVPNVHLYDAYNSFPSGHTLAAFSLFVFLALISRQVWLQVGWVVIALIVGISRIYLHYHFLEDVLFGAFCGTALAYTGFILQRRLLVRSPVWDRGLPALLKSRRA